MPPFISFIVVQTERQWDLKSCKIVDRLYVYTVSGGAAMKKGNYSK